MASTPPISGCSVSNFQATLPVSRLTAASAAPLLLARDDLERAAEPELAAGVRRLLDVIGHRLVQVGRVGQAQLRIDRHRATIRRRRWRPAACARPPCVGSTHMFSCGIIASREADQLAGGAVVHVDVAGLAAVDHDVDHLAALVLRLGQDRRADRVEVPDVVRDVLEVPLVGAGVEVDRDDRVGVQVVARAARRRTGPGDGIADDEEHGVRLLVDRGRHPHAAAERLVEVAVLGAALPSRRRCRGACCGRSRR